MSHAHGYVPVRSEKMAAQPTKCAFEEDENGQEVDFCVVFVLKNGASSKTKTRFISLNQSARKRDLVDRVFSLDEGTFAKPCESNQLTSSFLYAGTSVSGPWISVEGGCKIGSLHTDFVKDENICKRWLE